MQFYKIAANFLIRYAKAKFPGKGRKLSSGLPCLTIWGKIGLMGYHLVFVSLD